MINVKIELGADGSMTAHAVGHAGDEKTRSDVVCSAHSMIAYVLGQSFILMDAEGKLKEKPTVKIERGCSFIKATPKDDYYNEALHCVWSYTVGCGLLEKEYPQYVKAVLTQPQRQGETNNTGSST